MAQIENSEQSGKRTKKVSTQIDMTPMVDLAFLLITFFMLTTTFYKPKAMEVVMPAKNINTSPQPASKAITILLGENDKVYWYQGSEETQVKPQVQLSDYSSQGIRKVLLEKRQYIGKDFVVVIKALNHAKFKNMVDILDEMTITNTMRYAIVDTTPNDLSLIANM